MRSFLFAVVTLVAVVGSTRSENPAPVRDQTPKSLQISMKICEGDPFGEIEDGSVNGVAQLSIVTQEGKPGTFSSLKPTTIGATETEVGYRAVVTPTLTEDGRVRVKFELRYCDAPSEGKPPLMRTAVVETTKEIANERSVRIKLFKESEQFTWVELRFDGIVRQVSYRE